MRGAELLRCPPEGSLIGGPALLGSPKLCPATFRSLDRRSTRVATTTRAQASLTSLRRCSALSCLPFPLISTLNVRASQGVNYAVWAGGHDDIGVAGTSCASPTAAGIFSLINDKRLAAGKPTLGFMNPLLYKSKQSPRTRRSGPQ